MKTLWVYHPFLFWTYCFISVPRKNIGVIFYDVIIVYMALLESEWVKPG